MSHCRLSWRQSIINTCYDKWGFFERTKEELMYKTHVCDLTDLSNKSVLQSTQTRVHRLYNKNTHKYNNVMMRIILWLKTNLNYGMSLKKVPFALNLQNCHFHSQFFSGLTLRVVPISAGLLLDAFSSLLGPNHSKQCLYSMLSTFFKIPYFVLQSFKMT